MKIDKNYKGLKNVGWRYEYEGDIVTEKALEVDLGMRLYVSGSIEAGESSGISAGLQITCNGVLSFGLKCFAGVCTWREITDAERTITCGKLEGGTIEYGILVETGLENERKTM